MNRLCIIGNCGADPETRVTPSGMTVTNLRVAVNEKRKGEDHTEWFRVVLFDRQAEVARDYLAKGSKVGIEGRIETRKWQDKDGNDRSTTEVKADQLHLIDSRRGNEHLAVDRAGSESESTAPDDAGEPYKDDIPF